MLFFDHDRRISNFQCRKSEPGRSSSTVGVVWDTLAPDDLPVTDAERALLDARLAEMESEPNDQSPWPEAKARLERLLH